MFTPNATKEHVENKGNPMKDEKFRVVTNGRKMTYAEAIRCKKAVAEQDAAFSLRLKAL